MNGVWMDHAGGIAAIIAAIASLISAVGTVINGRRSARHEIALNVVQSKQDINRSEITSEILGVRHDIRNGAGDAVALKTVNQLKPVLAEMSDSIPAQIAETAASVLAKHSGKPPDVRE